MMAKRTTIQVDNQNGSGHMNLILSNMHKPINRRLSAPMIVHASTHHYRQHRSVVVDESFEEAVLISPLQRLSLSSPTGTFPYQNNTVNSLGTSAAGSANASPRHDVNSSSFNLSPSNSFNLPSSLNNVSPTSGR
jgi:hypothetical protein